MERSPCPAKPTTKYVGLLLAALTLTTSTGCLHLLVASSIYMWQGGNVVPAECSALDEQRVVVVCRPPAASEYRFAGASRMIAKKVTRLLGDNVPKIDVVNPREVDNWLDETGSDDFKDLGRAVKADRVVLIDLEHFDLFKGKTLYQGDASITVTVYDMDENGQLVWDRELGQVLFPANSAIPAQDKPVQQFQREFVDILSQQIAVHFYKHDPSASFAQDALANR